jgi:hypothetical protein
VLFGDSTNCSSSEVEFNGALASLLEDVRPAFEFHCGTWPEVFMTQAKTALRRLGLPALMTMRPRCISPFEGQSSAA